MLPTRTRHPRRIITRSPLLRSSPTPVENRMTQIPLLVANRAVHLVLRRMEQSFNNNLKIPNFFIKIIQPNPPKTSDGVKK